MPEFGDCRGCGARMLWARSADTRKRVPLDPEAVPVSEIHFSMWAFNPTTGAVRKLTKDLIESGTAAKWLEAGATLHTGHHATCPERARFRR